MFSAARMRAARYLGHAVLEGVGAHQHDDPLSVAGDVQRGLAGRVGRPDEVHVVALALAGLARGRAVVDAPTADFLQPGAAPASGSSRRSRPARPAPRCPRIRRSARPAPAPAPRTRPRRGRTASPRRTGRPGWTPGAPDPHPTAPSGSRGSSGSTHSGRPAPRAPPARPRLCCSPSDVPYTAAARPSGPVPTMHRSYSACSARVRRPSALASSSVLGARSVSPSGVNTSGSSATPRRRDRPAAGPRRRARARATGSGRGCGPGTS